MTDEVISNIVLYTNTYAAILKLGPSFTEKVGGCNRTVLDWWKDVNADDIWIYIAIVILTCFVSKPQIHMYLVNVLDSFNAYFFPRLMSKSEQWYILPEQLFCLKLMTVTQGRLLDENR